MNKIWFSEEQLGWLEEYPDCFVKVFKQPKGFPFQPQSPAQIVQINILPEFISENITDNLWRSWKVYRDEKLKNEIGPLPVVIDIDDESDNKPNLQHAYKLTNICIEELVGGNHYWHGISFDRIRIVFSGCKGFHIEIKPQNSIDAEIMRRDLISLCRQRAINQQQQIGNVFFNKTAIDVFHDAVRLTGSFNSWVNSGGELISRRVIQMSVKDFCRLELEGILRKAESIK